MWVDERHSVISHELEDTNCDKLSELPESHHHQGMRIELARCHMADRESFPFRLCQFIYVDEPAVPAF